MLDMAIGKVSTDKPSRQDGMQIMTSPVGTINTGTESCSVAKEGVLVTLSHEIFSAPITK
jgi:hypothetical protein